MSIESISNLEPWTWPEETGALIVDALEDEDGALERRLLAARMAGEEVAMDDDVAEALLIIVGDHDEPPELRAVCAIALGPTLELADMFEFDDPDDVPISEEMCENTRSRLHEVVTNLDEPLLVRRRALEASIRHPEDWHADAVRWAYNSGNSDWQLTAVFCMTYVHGFEAEIMDALRTAEGMTFAHAVEAAGAAELPGAWPVVAALIDSPDTEKDLLIAAIESAFQIDRVEASDVTAHLLEEDDEDIVFAIQEALIMSRGLDGDLGEGLELVH